ncbi:MAG: S49 family peptidase [Thiotrichaceae bacterium]|nr:S49 family peptidase [Thiotrichaceae bacterium]
MNESEMGAIVALKSIAMEGVIEQRRSRRWGIFFKIVFLLWGLLLLISMFVSGNSIRSDADEFTAVVDVKGVIMDGSDAGYAAVSETLQDAFADERTQGVILRINSPGGSAVQSAMIYDEIMRLRKKYKAIPVYAVIQDVGASGGYFIAAAAQDIFSNRSSIVGSIGVRMDSYGVVEVAKKIGIESRLVTAGENKAILDPFQPVSEQDTAHLKALLESTHKEFIKSVKEGRGDRLVDNPDIFSGLFWTGTEAKQLGLVDDFMTVRQVAENMIKAEEIVNFTPQKTFLDKLAGEVQMKLSEVLMSTRYQGGMQF